MEGDPNAILGELFQRIQMLEGQAQAPPALAPRHGNKPPKPDQFYGTDDAKRVRQWVFQVENYFVVTEEPVARRVAYATTLLRKNALLWWQSLSPEERPVVWEDFSRVLIEYFQPISATIVARDALAKLYQKSSVKAYVEEFKAQALNIPDITDAEKLDRFRRGLKRDVRLHVAFANPATFDSAVTVAEQIDEVLYSHRAPTPGTNRPYLNLRTNRMGHSSQAVPMEIGAIQPKPSYADAAKASFKRLTPEERAELNRVNGCYYCRKPGHRAIECPLKKAKQGNGYRRQ